jgi:hypothetical protein
VPLLRASKFLSWWIVFFPLGSLEVGWLACCGIAKDTTLALC